MQFSCLERTAASLAVVPMMSILLLSDSDLIERVWYVAIFCIFIVQDNGILNVQFVFIKFEKEIATTGKAKWV